MSELWSIPRVIWVANGLRALILILLVCVAVFVGGFMMRARWTGKRLPGVGAFLYFAGIWVLVRGLIGGIGAVLVSAVFLWEKYEKVDEEHYKKLLEELHKTFNVAWLLIFAAGIALLGKVGEGLRKLSEKDEEIARFGFRKLLRSRVSDHLPHGPNNSAAVLAYRAVWEDTFNADGKTIEGWRLRDLRERTKLIYYSPRVTAVAPNLGTAGQAVVISGERFIGARAVHFGTTIATVVHVDSDTQITATIPVGQKSVPVTVASYAGISSKVTAAANFQYPRPPAPPHKP